MHAAICVGLIPPIYTVSLSEVPKIYAQVLSRHACSFQDVGLGKKLPETREKKSALSLKLYVLCPSVAQVSEQMLATQVWLGWHIPQSVFIQDLLSWSRGFVHQALPACLSQETSEVKAIQGRFRLNNRKKFFPVRVVRSQHKLPRKAVAA